MGLFSSSQTTTTKTDPYGAARGPMDSALSFMGSQPYMQAYGGPYNAAINPLLSQNLSNMGTAGNSLYNQTFQPGLDMMGRGMTGYENQLSALQNRGPNQFRFDQGTANTIMNNYMPGLQSQAALQGKLSSRALQSDLGQLMGAAGAAGQFGTGVGSKLAGQSAAASALNQEALQRNIKNLYMGARGQANQAGLNAGLQNMNALNRNDAQVLGGYGNLANMGKGMAGMGLQGLGLGLKAGQIQQGLDQFGIDSARQQFMDRQMIPMQDAMARAQLAGNLGQAFGTTTSRTKNNPSLMSSLGQVAGLAGSVFGGLGGTAGLSSLFGFGGGAGPQFGFGAGTANMSNPMDGWWM